jgi:hypothetical protein
LKIPITPEFTVIISGHGKTKSYLHRFKLIANPMCAWNEGTQSTEHLIYDCKIPDKEKLSNVKLRLVVEPGPPQHAFSSFIKSINFNKPQ